MQTYLTQKLEVTMVDKHEIQAFKNILTLAAAHLRTQPVRNLSGSPLKSQAGIKGTELIQTKEMLTTMFAEVGLDKPTLEPGSDFADGNFERFIMGLGAIAAMESAISAVRQSSK